MILLKYLEKQAKLSSNLCISYDELVEWPVEQVEKAKQQGHIVPIDGADGIICRQCPEHCWKDVEIRQKNGRNVGVFFCENEDCAGLITIELERLQQWRIDKKKLSREAAKKKNKKKTKKRNEAVIKQWDKVGNACFIHDNGNIKFYFKEQMKPIPLRSGTQAPKVLTGFLGGTQTGEAIKGIADSLLPPSQVIRNINRTLNEHLRKIGFGDISGVSFIYLDDNSNSYTISPKIVTFDEFERAHFHAD